MTMVPTRCRRGEVATTSPRALVASGLACLLMCWGATAPVLAQRPDSHYRHQASMSPGAIGSWQLQRGGPLPGYYQPVEIQAPQGALVSLAVNGAFEPPQPAPRQAGLLIAPVYRLRVSGIPNEPGAEVFPTLEIIDRLYPPRGQAARFPIVVQIAQEDLQLALSGKFVTRVIYLENPETALPEPQPLGAQRWFDSGPGEDPLYIADTLGRPMAILRMGARLPDDPTNPGQDFLYGSPPLLQYAPPPVDNPPPAGAASHIEAPVRRGTLWDRPRSPTANGGPILR